MKDLTSSAGEDVVLAMNTFIKRLLAVSDPGQMKVCHCIMLYHFFLFGASTFFLFTPWPKCSLI